MASKNKIVRGTTPEITFKLPVAADTISEMYATFKQLDQNVIEHQLADATVDGNNITVLLTQDETLALQSAYDVDLQLRFVTTSGRRLASQHIIIDVEDVNKDGVI